MMCVCLDCGSSYFMFISCIICLYQLSSFSLYNLIEWQNQHWTNLHTFIEYLTHKYAEIFLLVFIFIMKSSHERFFLFDFIENIENIFNFYQKLSVLKPCAWCSDETVRTLIHPVVQSIYALSTICIYIYTHTSLLVWKWSNHNDQIRTLMEKLMEIKGKK